MSKMITCYIGLGSNQNNPVQQLNQALTSLTSMPQSCLVQASAFYQSKALMPSNPEIATHEITIKATTKPADYINAVAEIITALSADELLDNLLQIEKRQGRVRDPSNRWASRTLDLDLLLYADTIIETDRLTVPHYDMKNRNFVLQPLHDLKQDLLLPDGSSVASLLATCPSETLTKLGQSF